MTPQKSLVLLSAGLDSSVNLLMAMRESTVMKVLTFDYGQKAAVKEVEQSRRQCARLGVSHEVVPLPWLRAWSASALTNSELSIPMGGSVDILNAKVSQQSARAVWVSNRNGVFLNIAAACAEGLGVDWIVPGFNREEAETFPDNSEDFLNATNRALSYSTRGPVQVKCWTLQMQKTQILKSGLELGLRREELWTCYQAGPEPCGACESCQRFLRAEKALGWKGAP